MDITSKWILGQAKLLYGVDFRSENHIGASGNLVFEVTKKEVSYILKVTPYSPVNEKHIKMQVEWVRYLSSHMSGISKPIHSIHHRLYEIIFVNDKRYLMFLQEKAAGRFVDIKHPRECNEALFFQLGVLCGRMHKLTVSYKNNVIDPYFVWDNDAYSWRGNVPIKDDEVRLFDNIYKEEINALPISKDNYGIIHYDIHPNNFFVDNENITIFDFDACQFNWYAADIASTLFFMVQEKAGPRKHLSEKERSAFVEQYLIAYLNGYTQSKELSTYWLYTFDLFMKYQMIDEYRCAQEYMKEELGNQHLWYLDWFKDRIVHRIPYVTIDYQSVIEHVPNIRKDR